MKITKNELRKIIIKEMSAIREANHDQVVAADADNFKDQFEKQLGLSDSGSLTLINDPVQAEDLRERQSAINDALGETFGYIYSKFVELEAKIDALAVKGSDRPRR